MLSKFLLSKVVTLVGLSDSLAPVHSLQRDEIARDLTSGGLINVSESFVF
jgi:hypothetical protein